MKEKTPGTGGCRKCNFWMACLLPDTKFNIRNPDVESYRLVYIWVKSGRGGGSPGEVLVLGGSPVFSGPRPRNFKCITGILSSCPVECHLL